MAAEREWLGLFQNQGTPVHIFRLPGIYGPGRSPLDRVREGKAHRIDLPGQVFSRVHVDDIANGVVAALDAPLLSIVGAKDAIVPPAICRGPMAGATRAGPE